MTTDELNAIADRFQRATDEGFLHKHDFALNCYEDMPKLIAEVRRLREELERSYQGPDDEIRGVPV